VILVIDNYDSFTYMLNDYILQCGIKTQVIRNDSLAIAELQLENYKGIIIGPGPNRPSEAGELMTFISKVYLKIPLLGVCLGHQAIGEFFGASLVGALYPMHGKTSIVNHNGHPLFNKIPNSFEVMRYHSLILKELKEPLLNIATTNSDELMALAHNSLPIAAVQFHPESIMTPDGLQIIKNWLEWAKILV
jgi:anthranilate synthase/aminodeoxychorismate synthase-like glutamine amidotransferase